MAEIEINKHNNETKNSNDKAGSSSSNAKTGNQSGNSNSDITNKLADAVRGDTDAAKDVYNQAKTSAGEAAGKVYDKASETAASVVGKQKSNLANDLSSIAQSIRQMNENVPEDDKALGIASVTAIYGNTIADKIEQVSKYVDKKDLGEMLSDAEKFAHRNPTLFVGGAFALGFLAARFLKSGGASSTSNRSLSGKSKTEKLTGKRDGVHLPNNLDELSTKNNQKDSTAGSTGSGSSASAASNKGV